MQYLRKGTFDDIPAIYIYRLIHCTLTEPNDIQHYTNLLEALKKHEHLFSRNEARGMYVFAQNFCIRRINSGDKDALGMIFALYQEMVDKHLIFEGNFVSQPDFKNIVTTGLRLGEDEWVGNFIEEFYLVSIIGIWGVDIGYDESSFHFMASLAGYDMGSAIDIYRVYYILMRASES